MERVGDTVTKTVLIADDAKVMRDILKDIFNSLGLNVVGEATTGKEAVEMAKQLKPDIITMDIVMPELNGIQALKEIIASNPDVVIIVVSALGHESLVMEALKNGAKDFVVKPFKKEDIVKALQKYL